MFLHISSVSYDWRYMVVKQEINVIFTRTAMFHQQFSCQSAVLKTMQIKPLFEMVVLAQSPIMLTRCTV